MEIRSEIRDRVNQLMHEGFEIPLEKLVPEAKLYEDLSLDSLDAVDMLVHLEESLGTKIAGEKFIGVRTLGDIYRVTQEVISESQDASANTLVGPSLGDPQPEVG